MEYDRKLDERFNNKGIEKQEIFDKEMDDRISVTDVVVEIDKKKSITICFIRRKRQLMQSI